MNAFLWLAMAVIIIYVAYLLIIKTIQVTKRVYFNQKVFSLVLFAVFAAAFLIFLLFGVLL